MTRCPVVAYTVGEPAGVGPDLAPVLAAQARDFQLVVIGPRNARGDNGWRAWDGNARPGVAMQNVACAAQPVPGRLDVRNAPAVLAALKRAADGCVQGEFDALVTGPVHKGVINDAGVPFSGHTEFFAAHAGVARVVMMLTSGDLRVALATTHLPLAQVPAAITADLLREILTVLQRDLRARFGLAQPRIMVLGLNPHAGEGGHLGLEESRVIEPTLAALRHEGLALEGPVPADTAFTPRKLAQADVVLAMYHDQGLPVLKHHGFGNAVNVTLGLPYIRTSVDHGTALDLAGTRAIDPGSALAALKLALELVRGGRPAR